MREYELKRSARARRMRITISLDSRVIVTVPQQYSLDAVPRFVAKHAAWIQKAIVKNRDRHVIRLVRKDIPMLKRRAAVLSSARCEYFARQYGTVFKKISIRAQKSRWGSCSRKRTLSFNYKIATLPEQIRDYIIVHEVCHLLHMNHSPVFWNAVEQTIPNHRVIRKTLRNTVVIFS